MIITIDGPAGTGKTTIAREVARRLNFQYFDTGATYRAITLFCMQNNIDLSDPTTIAAHLPHFSFTFTAVNGEKHYFINNQEVTTDIRLPEVTQNVSTVSAHKPVRELVWDLQRKSAEKTNAVFEGRDMGTVVFPHAELKVFLTAAPEERARRRFKEYQQKDAHKDLSEQEVLDDIQRRDTLDSTRKLAPLRQAEDAHLIDTTHLTIEEVIQAILTLVKP